MTFKKGHPVYSTKGRFSKGNTIGSETRFGNGKPPWNKGKGGYSLRHNGQFKKGQMPSNYKGGIISFRGYVRVKKWEHHFHDANGYVKRSHLVVEDEWKCCLLRWADVHHRDENKLNDVWYNLWPMTHEQHSSLHLKKRNVVYATARRLEPKASPK